jgi:RNA polymerase sigma factor (sigma-70 family)
MRSDRKAQFQLYKSCFSLLMGICRRYHSNENDAAAIMNQGFMKILTNIKKYRPEIPFEAWARKVMINTLIDEFRENPKSERANGNGRLFRRAVGRKRNI